MVSNVFVEKPLQDVKQGKYPNINLKLLDVRDNVVSNVCVCVEIRCTCCKRMIYTNDV